jgi:hypothetical protein
MIDIIPLQRGFVDGEWQDGELRGLTFLAGERGMGKTEEAIRLVSLCTGWVIAFDTVGTHVDRFRRIGFVEFNQPGKLEEYLRANRGRRARVVYVPRDEWPEKHLIAVCIMARAFGQLILLIDEIDQYCGPEWGQKGMPVELYNLAHFGRHYKVSMLCTARDPATLSIKFRSQCAFMRIFRTTEERYVKYFEARIGRENAAKLPTLKKTYFLLWSAGSSEAPIAGGPRRL